MRYVCRIAGRDVRVELDARGALLVDGEAVPADLVRTGDGAWSVLVGDESHEVVILERAPLRVRIDGQELALSLVDERELGAGVPSAATADATVEVRAPMSGLIVSVHVREGEIVDEGGSLCTLEAMKMENELVSPRRGRVSRLAAVAGAKVNGGDVLAILGPE